MDQLRNEVKAVFENNDDPLMTMRSVYQAVRDISRILDEALRRCQPFTVVVRSGTYPLNLGPNDPIPHDALVHGNKDKKNVFEGATCSKFDGTHEITISVKKKP